MDRSTKRNGGVMEQELDLTEAWKIAQQVRQTIEVPDRATNESVSAEWAAIDAALLERGIVARRSDCYGNSPEGHSWWVCQRADGFITGKWCAQQALVAVELSVRESQPLRWLVRDPDNTIHRRYFPKTATSKTNRIFPLTDGPAPAPTTEQTLLDLLEGWDPAA